MNLVKLTAISASALFLLAVAILLRATELYIMSAAIATLPIVSAIAGIIGRHGIKCTRTVPSSASEGSVFSIDTTITGARGAMGPIWADIMLPEWLEPCRNTGSIRWVEGGAVQSTSINPAKRGLYKIGSTVLHLSDPLGFFIFSRKYMAESRLAVLPVGVPIPEIISALPQGKDRDYDMDGASTHGGGVEFQGVREYQYGDDLRRIHWRSAARYGKLNVVEFEQAGRDRLVIAIERKKGTEAGRGPWSTLECSIKVAAAVAKDSLEAGASVRLAGLRGDSQASLFGSGPEHLSQVLYALASVEADAEESIGRVLQRELAGMHEGTTVICLSPSLTDELAGNLSVLAESGIRSHIVLLLPEGAGAPPPSATDRLDASGTFLTLLTCSRVKELAHAT